MSLNLSRSAKHSSASISLTPLIDVIFQLLVFFMLTSSFINPAIKLDLPDSDATVNAITERQIIISLKEDGSLYLNKHPIAIENLSNLLQSYMKVADDKAVFFRADKQVSYDMFFSIMQTATKAGAKNFQLIYSKEKN